MSKETFETLLSLNLKSLQRMVQSKLTVKEQADDIIQQALLRAYSRRDQLRSESNFKSWLLTIAVNEIRMHFRAKRPYASLEEFPNLQLVDASPSPHASCEQREREERLRAGIARLSKRDRTAIHLADIDGLTAAAAARKLSISIPAFKSTHFRARLRLGEKLRNAA